MTIFEYFGVHKHPKEVDKLTKLTLQVSLLALEVKRLRRILMATKAEVLQAIADEKAQVIDAINELDVQIQALKDQIEAGSAVTAADLDDITTAVHDIFIPAELPPA